METSSEQRAHYITDTSRLKSSPRNSKMSKQNQKDVTATISMDRESNYKTHGGGPSTQLVTNNKTSSTLAAANSAIIPHKVKNLRDYITNRNNKEIPLDKEVP